MSMPSTALATWRSDRTDRLNRLQAVHAAVGGVGPGRRWLTDEVNHALVLRMAAEFQGYARDLHNEASHAIARALAPSDPQRQAAILIPYTVTRRLDRGNAEPGGLGQDFGLFGMELWTAIRQRHPERGQQWLTRLQLLNEARNGLAHDSSPKIARVVAAGWPLTLQSVRKWRNGLDGLAKAMDHVTREHLRQVFGTTPW
jgi:hypothetical protein